MIIKLLFKDRFQTKKALNFIRWVIIIYAFTIWTTSISDILINPEKSVFMYRINGPYSLIYIVSFLAALILPASLLIKKLAINYWYVLIVAISIKIGVYFERFVIVTTSYHRDHLTGNRNTDLLYPYISAIGMIFIQGVLIAILILAIMEVIERKTAKQSM